ncbi:uncharacterized protein LOC109823158 [Asparagus officinalis]|uniref:uncharacterized protein LOC109823158 n=1 Tax=Asparagus officinalis TaxID=4686 RepID=UPI00098DF1DC|nr:uncharacterized protein LOC109823158 [Asparagus officinalis]
MKKSNKSKGEEHNSTPINIVQFVIEDVEENLEWLDEAYVNNEYVQYEELTPDEFEDDEWIRSSIDVGVLLGLKVDGDAVMGTNDFNWRGMCERLLSQASNMKGSKIKLECVLVPFLDYYLPAVCWLPLLAVVRRDRSLGGREVVVATSRRRESERGGKNTRVLGSPLSNLEGIGKEIGGNLGGKRVVGTDELPEWWTKSVSKSVGLGGDEMLKGEADRLVRAILDNRLHGKDYKDDDIIQLRQICKISGARVSFGTANARDAFYRASVNFVLNICSRVMQPADTIQINGEDARQFICGLADNIGLEDIRAARILRAAVAAKTRSCFLQSWSFEVQGKRFEALKELSKICQIFQIFPPEEYSPEMEMVASGLKKTIGIEQRKHLLTLFKEACGANCQKTAEEALGIVYSNGYEGGDNESNYANSELL